MAIWAATGSNSSPNLDRMAAEGMRFTQLYAGSTVCAPSRSVLMTGKHMGHTRVRGNAPRASIGLQALRTGDRTLAHVFKDSGYATALFGGAWARSVPKDIPIGWVSTSSSDI